MASSEIPDFVRLAGHPVRWNVLTALSGSDLRVRELTAAVGEPQSLVSYHLRLLRDGGLVSKRQSSADGRDAYYHLNLARCEDLLQQAGRSLHPALESRPPGSRPPRRSPSGPVTMLFACTGNSGRSPIAAALARAVGGSQVTAVSAGSHPRPIAPEAVAAIRPYGVDLSLHRSSALNDHLHERFDIVVTLCDKVREVCPEFPGHPQVAHWSIADPGAAKGAVARRTAYRTTAAEIRTRVEYLLARVADQPRRRRTS